MMIKDNLNIKIDGVHYKESKDTFTIFNVPIAAQLVQPYVVDGETKFAFKSKDEISKIVVENVPITMRFDEPAHPSSFLGSMPSDVVGDNVVGFMREPSNPRADLSSEKRYADMVLFKNDRTSKVIDSFKNGVIVDTSIGFYHDVIEEVGVHDGVRYDFKQVNIRLDHNAILMDGQGRIGTGRMPSPIGGIGADIQDLKSKKLEAIKMSEDVKALKEQLDSVTKERDAVKLELKEKSEALAKDEKDKFQKQIDSLKADVKKAGDEKVSLQKEFDSMKDKLKTFEDQEKARIDVMRDELKKAKPGMDELFDEAKDELIVKYHADLLEQQKKAGNNKGIGADMMGSGSNAKVVNEFDRTKEWSGAKKVKGDA